ncbi:MAG: response regulator [Anaerolineae bacterium]|nr:response regulator [Anaerolineae bacterium]
MTVTLSDEGYQVEAATPGKAALKAPDTSEERLPDVIIADIVMPEMNGLELSEAVRNSPDLVRIRI